MNCFNNSSVEAGAGTGAWTGASETGASGAGAFGGPTSLGAGVPLGLAGCSGLLGLTVLGGMFL